MQNRSGCSTCLKPMYSKHQLFQAPKCMNCIEWIKQVLACVMAGHIFPTPYHTQRWILYRMHHNLAEGEFPQLSEERWNHLRVRGGRLALRPGALTPNPQWFQENCLVCGEPAQAGTGLVPRYLWIEFQTLEPVWGEGSCELSRCSSPSA